MSTSARPSSIALLAVAFLLAAGCNPAATAPLASSTASVPPATATTPAPTVSPSRGPAPSPSQAPLGAAWTYVHLGAGEIQDIAHGDAGYVAVGSTCTDDCPGSAAAAWFSADGSTWSSVSIPDGDEVELRTVATDGSTWYTAGERFSQDGRVSGFIWRSTNATTWTRIESFEVGICYEGCPVVGSLAALPGSALLTTPFGIVGTVNDGYLMLAGGVAWDTGGARKLVREVKLIEQQNSARVASDGDRVVVLASLCEEQCFTSAWSSEDGRNSWVSTRQPMPIVWTEPQLLVFAGGSFFTAGQRAPSGVGVYASRDGVTWTEIRTDLSLGECRLNALAGTDRELVIAPDANCAAAGIFLSRAP